MPDNLKAVVEQADPTGARLNQAFVEYAQARGFVVDPARVRAPQDKGRVERVVPFVRGSFFAGESFIDLPDAQRRAEQWGRQRAGMRIHGTIQARPAEVFRLKELPRLAPAPTEAYDVPIYTSAKVHRDHHIEVAKALSSVPGDLIGSRVEVRADRALVRISARGRVVKVHPRQAPGGRVTDAEDLPAERSAYALRDLDKLTRMAADHGPAVGAFAAALLDHPLPWTKMRQVYALLGLVKRWGPERVGRPRLRWGPGARDGQRRSHRAHPRAGRRGRRGAGPGCPGGGHRALRPGSRRVRHPQAGHGHRGPAMSAPAPTIGPELRALLRRVKLGRCLDTQPEHLALAPRRSSTRTPSIATTTQLGETITVLAKGEPR